MPELQSQIARPTQQRQRPQAQVQIVKNTRLASPKALPCLRCLFLQNNVNDINWYCIELACLDSCLLRSSTWNQM